MKCTVCNNEFDEKDLVKGYTVRPALARLIKEEHPDWNDQSYICKEDLRRYRERYLSQLVKMRGSRYKGAEERVIKAITENSIITSETNRGGEEPLSLGDRVADSVAKFGGSWKFIISFVVVLLIWITINVISLFTQPFDPYPFILLNLILSCLAAVQAPVIMMSQNRQEAKDRQRAEDDYKVNLKSELEIKVLDEKIDHLMQDQRELLEEVERLHRESLALMREKAAQERHE